MDVWWGVRVQVAATETGGVTDVELFASTFEDPRPYWSVAAEGTDCATRMRKVHKREGLKPKPRDNLWSPDDWRCNLKKDGFHQIRPYCSADSTSHLGTCQDGKAVRSFTVRSQDWKQEFQRPYRNPGPVMPSEPQLSHLENEYNNDLRLSEHSVRLQRLWSVLRSWIRDRAVSLRCLVSNEHYTSCRMEHFWTGQLLQSLKCKNYHRQETRHRHLKVKSSIVVR